MAMQKKTEMCTRAKAVRAPKPKKFEDSKVTVSHFAIREAVKRFVELELWDKDAISQFQNHRNSLRFPTTFDKEAIALIDLMIGNLRIHTEAIKSHSEWFASWCEMQFDHAALEREIRNEQEQRRLAREAQARGKELEQKASVWEEVLFDIYSADGTQRILQ